MVLQELALIFPSDLILVSLHHSLPSRQAYLIPTLGLCISYNDSAWNLISREFHMDGSFIIWVSAQMSSKKINSSGNSLLPSDSFLQDCSGFVSSEQLLFLGDFITVSMSVCACLPQLAHKHHEDRDLALLAPANP